MTAQDPAPDEGAEERAWREIVENYGERPDTSDLDLDQSARQRAGGPDDPDDPDDLEDLGPEDPADEPGTVGPTWLDDPEERYVPPPPPPLPRPTGIRAVAWAGIFVAPLLMLVAMVLGLNLPGVVDLAFVGWFVGGFVYLVATMRRSPPDPWDDGSRV